MNDVKDLSTLTVKTKQLKMCLNPMLTAKTVSPTKKTKTVYCGEN